MSGELHPAKRDDCAVFNRLVDDNGRRAEQGVVLISKIEPAFEGRAVPSMGKQTGAGERLELRKPARMVEMGVGVQEDADVGGVETEGANVLDDDGGLSGTPPSIRMWPSLVGRRKTPSPLGPTE